MDIANPPLGTWFIGIFGFAESDFTFKVTASNACPNDCSLHGTCIGTACQCNIGYAGAACDLLRGVVDFDKEYQGFVSANSWNYYTVVADSMNPILITVDHQADGSDCDVYVRADVDPTLTEFTYRNVTMNPHIELLIPDPGSQPFHVGVYGYSTCKYRLKFIRAASNACSCSANGRCVNGRCICNAGFGGAKCDQAVSYELRNNAVAMGSVVADGSWTYYQFKAENTHQFVVVVKEMNSTGMLSLYVSQGSSPTLDHFTAVDQNRLEYHRISLKFTVKYSSSFSFGVYGKPNPLRTQVPFMITAYQVPF